MNMYNNKTVFSPLSIIIQHDFIIYLFLLYFILFNIPISFFYFLCLLSASNNASASSSVFTLNKIGTGGGVDSGIGKQTSIIVFLFIRFVGILSVNKVLSNKFPKEVSARTNNCVFSFGVGFRNSVPTPRAVKLPSFLIKTLHL